MVKRFHCGRAAQSGVYSAQLAQRGFTGILDALEAPYGGFLSTCSDKPIPEMLTAGLGTTWETHEVGFKPHASVTSIHTSLDALRDLMRENNLTADDIASVDAGVSHMTYVHCAWPYEAQGITAAQMNMFYGLSVIALDGVAFVDQYQESRLRDPRILDFIGRTKARVDERIERMGAAYRHACRLTLTTRDGRTFEREILNRRSSPENPLAMSDVEDKFRNVVRSCLSPSDADRLFELTREQDKLESTRELIEILAKPTAAPAGR